MSGVLQRSAIFVTFKEIGIHWEESFGLERTISRDLHGKSAHVTSTKQAKQLKGRELFRCRRAAKIVYLSVHIEILRTYARVIVTSDSSWHAGPKNERVIRTRRILSVKAAC